MFWDVLGSGIWDITSHKSSLPIGLVYTFRVGIFSVNYDLLDDDLLDDNFWSEKSNLVDLS